MYGEFPISKMLVELERDDLLPAILFRTSRRQCDVDVEKLARIRTAQLSSAQRARLEGEVQEVVAKYALEEDVVRSHIHYDALVQTGVGAHHAGQLLVWRLLLEELMSRGVLRIMVATGTVAAGPSPGTSWRSSRARRGACVRGCPPGSAGAAPHPRDRGCRW